MGATLSVARTLDICSKALDALEFVAGMRDFIRPLAALVPNLALLASLDTGTLQLSSTFSSYSAAA